MIDLQRVASLFRPPPAATTDLNLLDSCMVYSQTQLDHIWYEVELYRDGQWQHGYKVVILRELWALPAPPRDERATEPDVLDRTRTMLRGLYNAKVDLIYVAAGMFGKPRLGVAHSGENDQSFRLMVIT